MKNKVVVTIADRDYTMVAVEDENYVRKCAAHVDQQLREIANSRISQADAAVLAAMNIADQYFREQDAAENLRRIRDVAGMAIRPAEVQMLRREGNRAELRIVIHEGRNRQIRRMCARCGLEVLRLQRVREHCLELGTLPLGQWRYLTAAEITALKTE